MRLIKSATMTYRVLGMKLYRITYDSQDDYIEAPDFATAVLTWNEHKLALWKKVEPERVELVHDEPVVRRQHEILALDLPPAERLSDIQAEFVPRKGESPGVEEQRT